MEEDRKKRLNIAPLLIWVAFFGVLSMTLPHTATILSFLQEDSAAGTIAAWGGAISYEVSVLTFTYARIQYIKRMRVGGLRRYVNWFGAGTLMAVLASAIANTWYIVEYQRHLVIYDTVPFTEWVTVLLFGTALPVMQFVFAEAVVASSGVVSALQDDNRELQRLRRYAKKLEREIAEREKSIAEREQQLQESAITLDGVASHLHTIANGNTQIEKATAMLAIFPNADTQTVASVLGVSPSTVTRARKRLQGMK